MISQKVIKELIFDMLEKKYATKSYRADLDTDIQDIVNTCEEVADYIERGRYDLTAEEEKANHEHYDSRI